MPKPLHHPSEERTFDKGANIDVDKEVIPNKGQVKGQYVDGENIRNNSRDGHQGAASRIKGEEIEFPQADNSCTTARNGKRYYDSAPWQRGTFIDGDWFCVGSTSVTIDGEKKVES